MKNYYRELNKVQRQIPHIDIVTFTGFMTKEEKLEHLDYYANQVGYVVNFDD